MAEIRTLIADDEPTARRSVRLLLDRDPAIRIVGECGSGAEAVAAIQELEPDLLFLDIQMADRDGFAVLSQIPADTMPVVIFVTAFDEYALRAFDVDAADYLLKPFTDERFHAAVERAKERLDRLAGPDSGAPFLERIAVPGSGAVRLLPVDAIQWIEARGDYVRIHSGDRMDVIREPISRLETRLDPRRFVRVHRSAIVNLICVKEVRTPTFGAAVAVLHNGQRCPLSRAGRQRLERVLGQPI